MSCELLPSPFDTRRAAHASVQPAKQETCVRTMTYAERCALTGLTADEVAAAFRCDHNHVAPRISELLFRGSYGFTADELVAPWNCSPNHVAPRISELKKSGRLIETKRTRLTRSGSPARV